MHARMHGGYASHVVHMHGGYASHIIHMHAFCVQAVTRHTAALSGNQLVYLWDCGSIADTVRENIQISVCTLVSFASSS